MGPHHVASTLDGLRGSSFRDDALGEVAAHKLRDMAEECGRAVELKAGLWGERWQDSGDSIISKGGSW